MAVKRLSCLLLFAWIVTFGCFYLLEHTGTASADSGAHQPQAKEQTAAEHFKNIQILKDLPASELIPSMNFIADALGVRCDFCHVQPFSEDTKKEKQIARKMMVMMDSINKENFGGHQEVNCATCHQGHHSPLSYPPLAAGFVQPLPVKSDAQLPTADQILDKYVQALGGREAIDKLTSRESRGTMETAGRGKTSFETVQKTPDKSVTVQEMQGGSVSFGFDGSNGWRKEAGKDGRLQMLSGPRLVQARQQAEFFPALNVKSASSRLGVQGVQKIGDAEAYVLLAVSEKTGPERLYFDTKTGLLIRIFLSSKTALGPLPSVIDYQDYRTVDGVKVPFLIKETGTGVSTVREITEVKFNVPVEEARFQAPAH